MLTLKGAKAGPNQDRTVWIPMGASRQVIGLFDGHGELGHFAAERAVLDLPFRVLKAPSRIRNGFLQVDRSSMVDIDHSGTTAIIILQEGSTVTLASVGDSTAVIASVNNNATATILAETVHHKPHLPNERERIERAGGIVWIPPPEAVEDSSRVLLPGNLALAMSRSLGDHEGKTAGYLSAEPALQVLDVRPQSKEVVFVVAASDGLVDHVPIQKVVRQVGKALMGRQSLQPVCERLVELASKRWAIVSGGFYRDDISLVVTQLWF